MSLMLTKTTIRVSAPSCTTLVFFSSFLLAIGNPSIFWLVSLQDFPWEIIKVQDFILDVSGVNRHCPCIRSVWKALAAYRRRLESLGPGGNDGLNDTNWCVFNDGNGNLTQVIVTIYNNIQKMGYDSIIIGI